MRSVPTIFTSKKQNGKSRTLRARYTPTVAHPYSRDSFRNRPLRESDSSAFGPPDCDLLDHDQLKLRFCVLDSRFCVVVVLLHACELRRNGDAVDPAARPAVRVPFVATCMLLEGAGMELAVFRQACVASLCKGEFVVVVVVAVVANGWRPSGGNRSARNMLAVFRSFVLFGYASCT